MPKSNQIRDGLEPGEVGAPFDEVDAELVSERQRNGDQCERIDTEVVAKRRSRIERTGGRTLRVLEDQRRNTSIHVHVSQLTGFVDSAKF